MQKLHLALLLVFACTTASYAQNSPSTSQSSQAGVSTQSSMPSAPGYNVRKAPVGSLTESFVYQYSPNQLGANRSLMGWSVVPEVNLMHHFGLQADFESLYMRSVYPGQSQLIMTAGPRYTLAPRSHFTPFIYAEAGEARFETQRQRNVDWEPVAKGGFGLQTRLSDHFGLTLVPGEWLGVRHDYNGSWNNSFSSRAGITFVFGGGSSKS
jgi:hypothetical protein